MYNCKLFLFPKQWMLSWMLSFSIEINLSNSLYQTAALVWFSWLLSLLYIPSLWRRFETCVTCITKGNNSALRLGMHYLKDWMNIYRIVKIILIISCDNIIYFNWNYPNASKWINVLLFVFCFFWGFGISSIFYLLGKPKYRKNNAVNWKS